MTSAGPWSVKGIDPRAREIAKDLARRSGMTLGEWLNQMITEGVDAVEPQALTGGASPAAAAPTPSISSTASLVAAAAADRSRRNADPLVSAHEANRISTALDTLTARLEAVESRSSAAINHVDRAVRTALSRLDAGERDTGVMMGKVETALQMIRADQRREEDRVARLERESAGRLEALRSLEITISRLQPPDTDRIAEAATARMARRLADAEARTRASMNDLAASLAGLDRRLAETEQRTEAGTAALDRTERQLEQLAAELGAQVDRARAELTAELTEQLNARISGSLASGVTTDRIETLELAINQLAGQVDQTEQVSAQAIDRMGREVMKIANAISDRVTAVESRSAGVSEQLSQEVGKIVDVMDKRLQRTEQTHTAALHKLSSDISKVAERLTDRIARHEGLTAEAVEGLRTQTPPQTGPQTGSGDISAVTVELTERIRASEERTARLLAEVRDRFLQREEASPTSDTQPEAAAEDHSATHSGLQPEAAVEAVADVLSEGGLEQEPALAAFHDDDDDGFVPPPFEDLAAPRARGPARTQALADAAPALHAPLEHGPELSDPADQPLATAEPEGGIADRELLAMFEGLDFGDAPQHELPAAAATQPLTTGDEDLDDGLFAPAIDAALSTPSDRAAEPQDNDLFVETLSAPATAPARALDELDAFFSDDPDFGHQPGVSDASHATRAPDEDAGPDAGPDAGTHDTPQAEGEDERPLTTRELIAQARNAARAASADSHNEPAAGDASGLLSPLARFRGKSRTAAAPGEPALGPSDSASNAARGPFGLALPRRKRKNDGVSTVTLLLATAVSLTVTATVLGFMIVSDPGRDEGHGPTMVARAGDAPTAAPTSGAGTAGAPAVADATAGAPAAAAANQLAVATAPNPASAVAPTAAGRGTDEARRLYDAAVKLLQTHDPKALPTLVRAAAAGDPAAQFHLSKIYERGGAGQPADLTKARMWAERAARAGVPEAMFNLGLFMYEGQGGPPDLPGAADWFTRAARLGLKDAQYNVARLYENGYGVTQNYSLAYQWYLVAADVSGDREAHADADRLRPTLTAEGRKAAEHFARTFRPAPATASASAPTTGKVAEVR